MNRLSFFGRLLRFGGNQSFGLRSPKKHPKTNRQSPQDKDRILACAQFPFCNKDCYIRVGCAVQIEPSIALQCLQSQACLNLALSFKFQQQACGDPFGVFPNFLLAPAMPIFMKIFWLADLFSGSFTTTPGLLI